MPGTDKQIMNGQQTLSFIEVQQLSFSVWNIRYFFLCYDLGIETLKTVTVAMFHNIPTF